MTRIRSLGRTAVSLGALVVVLACGDSPTDPFAEVQLEPEVEAFVDQMNTHRASVGCGPLDWNVEVAQVAAAHSRDMAERDYFSHENPEGVGPFDRLRSAGIPFSRAAENIAFGYSTGSAVLDGWLGSSGHRTNIENCALTEHGVGLQGTHWTHVFITP